MGDPEHGTWWQRAVFYQVYPRSFADGNGDGIGDFAGLIDRLDYLRDLGIDAIWLSPHYPSPFLDCGYDISDFVDVAPEYGTLDDLRRFVTEAHARDIRVVLDLVMNHSSDQHPWFQASRSSRDDPKRGWYVWRDGVGGGPPNDWVSIMGGSAWELDPATGQYYYHVFLKEQPDLDWRNPEVKQAMFDAVRFWLDLGVDGFRLDAIATVFEDEQLRPHAMAIRAEELLDANELSIDDYFELMRWQIHQPGIHELMQELRAVVDEYPGDRVLVAEDEDPAYHGTGDDELHLVFNFPLTRPERLTPAHIRVNQAERLAALPAGAWPCNTLGNHDRSRVRVRYGDGVHDDALARLHLALMLTLKGTPFLYNGEELGMTDLILTDLGQVRDTAATLRYEVMTTRLGIPADAAFQAIATSTRDRCRSPMPWTGAPNGGFCPPDVEPWLPANPGFADGVNVEAEAADPGSMLSFYRRLLAVRRATPALVLGAYDDLGHGGDRYLGFRRALSDGGEPCLVLLNFTETPVAVAPIEAAAPARIRFSSADRASGRLDLAGVTLAPFEVLIVDG